MTDTAATESDLESVAKELVHKFTGSGMTCDPEGVAA
jgi:hypothetical protein